MCWSRPRWLTACGSTPPPATGPTRDIRERAYRANNVGVALLEQLKYPEAAAAFREALTIDPTLAIGRLNLSLALMYEQDLEGAAREATTAAALMPTAPQPPYVLGLVARAQNRNDEARGFFDKVRQFDAADVGVNVNLAQIALEDRRYTDAVTALEPIVKNEPYHVTAAYVLGLALTRSGRTDEGQPLLERAQQLRRASYAVTFGTGYLEQGRYAEAVASTGSEPELVSHETPPARFTAARLAAPTSPAASARSGASTPSATLRQRRRSADDSPPRICPMPACATSPRDSAAGNRSWTSTATATLTWSSSLDGASSCIDTIRTTPGPTRQPAPDSSPFRAATSPSASLPLMSTTTVRPICSCSAFWRAASIGMTARGTSPMSRAHSSFRDSLHYPAPRRSWMWTTTATWTSSSPAWPTSRRPGNSGPAPACSRRSSRPRRSQLLRNNGNGSFTDITSAAKLSRRGHAIAVVPTDFDNHRDIDLLVVNSDSAPQLFSNQRDGTFRDVAVEVGLAGAASSGQILTAVAVGDVNKDDSPDFFFARTGTSVLALSNGQGRFNISDAAESLRGVTAAQFADYDNDGLLDLLAMSPAGLGVTRNVGPSWIDVTAAAVGDAPDAAGGLVRSLSVADVDLDGDIDIVATTRDQASVWRNSGDPRNRSLRVQLRGRVTNRSGVGSKVQVRAGSLSSRFETSAATPAVAPSDILFGLGARAGADVTRVLWPSGIVQAETAPAAAGQAGPGAAVAVPRRRARSQAFVLSVPIRVERRAIRVCHRFPWRRRDGLLGRPRHIQSPRPGRVRAHPWRSSEAGWRPLAAADYE